VKERQKDGLDTALVKKVVVHKPAAGKSSQKIQGNDK